MKTIRMRGVPSTVTVSRPVVGNSAHQIEQMAEEMIARWRRGEMPLAEEFLDREPEFARQAEATLELLAEELALRAELDRPTTLKELVARFPRWPAQVAALLECQRALGTATLAPRFPSPGEQLDEFLLLSELGRGAQGQVYLATQTSLANRPVVLKLGPSGSSEHLCLARLQHTHIVPLYSAHEFPDRFLTGFCMPYFGGTPLATILDRLEEPAPRTRTGRDLLDILRRVESDLEAGLTRSPALTFFDHASATETVCWIGACLADALQYAHDHGLLHLDLKPSNVLIAADGTPMLLDFHLARPPLLKGDPAPSRLGGTMGYMSPEQTAALKTVASGGPLAEGVDARADIYAFGVMLEQITRGLLGERSSVSPGLLGILARCTSKNAEDRYASAGEVASDLRRHLADLPLRGVSNRSIAERWSKWRRRRPYAMPLALTLMALILVCLGLLIRGANQSRRAELALKAGERNLAEHRYREASEAFRGGESLVEGVPLQSRLRDRLRESRNEAERGQLVSELRLLCEKVRPLYAAEMRLPPSFHSLAAQCRSLWDQRETIARQLATYHDDSWKRDLLDLAILTVHFETFQNGSEKVRHDAIETLDQAEAMFGPSRVLHLERARLEACESSTSAQVPEATTAWDYLVEGRASLAEGKLKEALVALNRSLALEPQSLWANFYQGSCCLRMGKLTEAVAAFSACVALAPESSWCVYNRGLAFQKSGNRELALDDFDKAVRLDPGFREARLGQELLQKSDRPR